MKHYSRFLTVMCGLALAAASVGGGSMPANAAGGVHAFRAVLTGQTAVKPCGAGLLCLTATDSGQAGQFGAARVVVHAQVQCSHPPCAAGKGPGAVTISTETGTYAFSNGDTMLVMGSVTACHGAGGTIAVGGFMVVGGTGRFAGARGSGRERIVESPTGAETVHVIGTVKAPGM
ncbi:MAG: hypothetical protein PVSMB7_27560 [Chloroflexota bacterium]